LPPSPLHGAEKEEEESEKTKGGGERKRKKEEVDDGALLSAALPALPSSFFSSLACAARYTVFTLVCVCVSFSVVW
jgi:hypothetical protein